MRCGLRFMLQAAAGVILLGSAASVFVGCAISADGQTALIATALRGDVRIVPELDADPGASYLAGSSPPPVAHIYSESGVGEAELRFAGGAIPPHFTLRLHLSGLEALTLRCDGAEVRASVQSYGDYTVRQTIVGSDGQAGPALLSNDDAWVPITPAYGEQAGADSHRPVYFDVKLPAAFTDAGCKLLRVDWIDYYR